MTPKFCHECGKKAESSWKMCPFCGTSFASLNEKPKTSQTMRPSVATVALVDENEDSDNSYLDSIAHFKPQIDSLDVDIKVQQNINKESIGQISRNPFSTTSIEPRTPPPFVSPEEALKQFQKEAGEPAKKIEIN